MATYRFLAIVKQPEITIEVEADSYREARDAAVERAHENVHFIVSGNKVQPDGKRRFVASYQYLSEVQLDEEFSAESWDKAFIIARIRRGATELPNFVSPYLLTVKDVDTGETRQVEV